ncbi:MAG: UDP-glucose/GDP-mannose dehydrogenase family protein [Elusimicrobia bacterium]|nr:UDP-glucose/GDP-mannose dehydrogenase family protein [Elusimicrobiota bacterium]
MSRVAIAGAGHVGLVYAGGLADLGHTIRVIDVDRSRVALLRRGSLGFFEPGLGDLLRRGMRRRRITFTTSYADALHGAEFVFVCVPTPSTSDGSLDDSMLRGAFDLIRRHRGEPSPVVVNKSTVPVGTGDLAAQLFSDLGMSVVSNPEFLSEGRALEDFYHPSRIVLGSRDRAAADAVRRLYAGIRAPVVYTDNATAEFSKLAANAFLATKVSFANSVAKLSGRVGADVDALTHILSLDPRIGQGHLRAGLGFGGSCLPKDVAAVEHLARRHGADPGLFTAVTRVNVDQRSQVVDLLVARYGSLAGRRVAILGVAYKPGTDDVRDAPAVALGQQLLALHAEVAVYDPAAHAVIRADGIRARQARSAFGAARGADAIVFATEWPELAGLDLPRLRRVMRGDVLIDGRGLIHPSLAKEAGFDYFGFGRVGRPPD